MKKHLDWLWLLIVIIIVIILVNSCKPVRYLDKHHAEICGQCIDEYTQHLPGIDTTKISKDTINQAGPGITNDFYQTLLFACDSNNQVQMIQVGVVIDSLKNKGVNDKGKIEALTRLVSNYQFSNGKLYINNKILQDSIKTLNTIIKTHQVQPTIITKPPITVVKTPVWVWFYVGFSILCILVLGIVVIKK